MAKSIRVRVLGRDYALRVREEDEAATRKVAAFVDEKMTAFMKAHPEQPALTAAVMSALVIAEQFCTLTEKHEQLVQALEEELVRLEARLAGAMGLEEVSVAEEEGNQPDETLGEDTQD